MKLRRGKKLWRKYDNDYLNLELFSGESSEAQFVICKVVLANDRLRCRVETKHPSLVTKTRDFPDRKLAELTVIQPEHHMLWPHANITFFTCREQLCAGEEP